MIKKVLLFFVFLPLFSLANSIDYLEKWIKNHKDFLKVSFVQKTYFKELEEEATFIGEVCIYRNLVKITYLNQETKEKQEILIKDNKAFIYLPEEDSLIITKVDKNLLVYKIFIDILNNPKSLKNNFVIENTSTGLLLRPLKKLDFKEISIFFEDKSLRLVEAIDIDENKITLQIKKIDECNKEPSLKVNPSTEVIRQY